MFQVKCADCGCLPAECKKSPSPKNVLIVLGKNVVVGKRLIKKLEV